ncbi:hypothetical protein [Neptunomonas qingdaonensis]|uniref:Uncharacterized protein n=1 Tax=Neptunomonas qingdaonensis TaxID=1045558 RepID=A0A1I2N531_9GAMM|nr:hypothetical protein [Neptunomonas qingdaonensis]SFF97949.1 hypothetical protein SAMN05216175_102253 [Neptunomonas qingdaonensis]
MDEAKAQRVVKLMKQIQNGELKRKPQVQIDKEKREATAKYHKTKYRA